MVKRFCTNCGKELTGGAFCTACGAPASGATYNEPVKNNFNQTCSGPADTDGYNNYNNPPMPPYAAVNQRKTGRQSAIAIIGIIFLVITFFIFTIAGFLAGAFFINNVPPEYIMLANALFGGRSDYSGIYMIYILFMILPVLLAIISAILAGAKRLYGLVAAISGVFMVLSLVAGISAIIIGSTSGTTIADNYTFILTGFAYLAGVIASVWTFIPSIALLIIAQVRKK